MRLSSAMTAGVATPDRRGRTGLDRTGRDLTGNPRVKVRDVNCCPATGKWSAPRPFDLQHADGTSHARTIMLLQWAAMEGPFAGVRAG